MMRNARWLAVAMLALSLSACGSKPKDMIIGKWETTDPFFGKVQTAEFTKDGKASLPVIGNIRVDGTYKFITDDEIEVEYSSYLGRTDKKTQKVVVTKETLTLSDDKGKTQLYKRVQ